MDSPPPRPQPPHPFYLLDEEELRLLKKLRHGLALAGFPTGRRRNSILMLGGNPPAGVRLHYYTSDLRWWRITTGIVSFEGFGPYRRRVLFRARELTLHHDELTEEIGVQLGRLIREPGWRWPLFANDSSYPGYAWSEKAWSTYQADWKLREARKAWVKARQEERRTAP